VPESQQTKRAAVPYTRALSATHHHIPLEVSSRHCLDGMRADLRCLSGRLRHRNHGLNMLQQQIDQIHETTINNLSTIIFVIAERVGREQRDPSPNVEQMDDIIGSGKTKVAALRKMRDEYENLITGLIV
jgi:hypothetical protein